ncbi:hypothetical protein WICMUC_005339 [Wickerhamomyces mucosus]|uniref:WD repeat-containing protein JIP5 n=1 Tax=Wickerhamomyces mucosus TaxID=1378264 RepID=A0A9P8P7X9_9ASCO|nr:hypothetical protein WICMUC_005339 [Wickerhamomyces mucosus]
MGKKAKRNKGNNVEILQSDVVPLLELKYGAPLFSFAAHPTKPIIASGLANGYVFVTQYDPALLSIFSYDQKEKLAQLGENDTKEKKKLKIWKVEEISKDHEPDQKTIDHLWKTKRHKGSVRSLCFNASGDEIFSVGSDNVIKKAHSETGKVIKKVEIKNNKSPITKILKSTTHPILVLGDESGNVRVYDSDTLKEKNFISNIHEDSVNSIVQIVHKSAYQFVSVGSTTLSVWDVRKDKATVTSENQEDEVLSVAYVDPAQGDTIACGMGEGIVTIWKQSKNNLEDQISRVKIAKDESIDSIISTMNNDDCVWAGASNGIISKINTKKGQVIETRTHSLNDEVSFLDLDYEYRLISAGMDKLKIWNLDDDDDDDEELDGDDFSDSSDEGKDEEEEFTGFSDEINKISDEENAWEDVDNDDDEEEKEEKKSGVSRLDLESEPEPEVKQPKSKKPKLSTKQLNNLQKHQHGIRKFDDL